MISDIIIWSIYLVLPLVECIMYIVNEDLCGYSIKIPYFPRNAEPMCKCKVL